MSIELYWGSGSGPSWRAMLAFVVKEVPFESRLVSFSKREHKTPEFLAMNPRGKVPALRDGSFVLNESLAIMAWLEEKFPEPPLFGTTHEETGQIWRLILEGDNHLNTAVREVVGPILFGSIEGKEETIRTAAVNLQSELRIWNERVDSSGWLFGTRLTAADLSVFTVVQFLLRGLTRPKAAPLELTLLPLDGQYPRLVAWMRRIEALPGYDSTYPPHWREG